MEKIDSRKLSPEQRYAQRKFAIRLKKSGKKHQEISEITGVRANTISSWIKSYRLGGFEALKENKRGVKSEDKKLLSDTQELEIQKMITDTMPDQLKLSYGLWTRSCKKNSLKENLELF